MTDSTWSQALHAREGFLLTRPRSFVWYPDGRQYIDDVPVSEAVFGLAYRGRLPEARTAWLAGFDPA